jgi:hypothetical protein
MEPYHFCIFCNTPSSRIVTNLFFLLTTSSQYFAISTLSCLFNFEDENGELSLQRFSLSTTKPQQKPITVSCLNKRLKIGVLSGSGIKHDLISSNADLMVQFSPQLSLKTSR